MQDNQQPGQLIVPQSADESPAPGTAAPQPERPSEEPAAQPAPTPGSSPEPYTPAPQPAAVSPAPSPAVEQAAPAAPSEPAAAAQAADDGSSWQFHHETDPGAPSRHGPLPDQLSWTAAEFTAHQKGFGWYGMLALIGVAVVVLVYLLTKDKLTTGILIFVLVVLGVYAGRKPRDEQYSLSPNGLQVGQKLYLLHDFKTFSVAAEGAAASIVLMPMKRFMPPLTVVVPPDVEERVVDFLSAYLPFAEHKADAVDSLLHRIRF